MNKCEVDREQMKDDQQFLSTADRPIARLSKSATRADGGFEPVILHLTGGQEARAADRNRQVGTAYIYVIEAEGLGLFKIGLATDLTSRFPHYRTECPVPCRPVIAAIVPQFDVGKIEKALHRRFHDRRKKGEWFALTEDDLGGLATAIREACKPALRALDAELRQYAPISRPPMDEAWLKREAELRQTQARTALPTEDLILDRVADAPRPMTAQCLSADLKHHYYRKPQDVHASVRALLRAGELAIVSPRRHPDTGVIWFDDYKNCDLIIPDVTCTWEETREGYEIQVSEPLGRTVPEFFGVSRW
jgi:hypothetical protein